MKEVATHGTAQGTDTLWAGLDEQARIDYGYRGVHVVALAMKAPRAMVAA